MYMCGCMGVCVCGSVRLALTGRRQSMPDNVVVAVVLDVVAAANCAACVAYAYVQIAHIQSIYTYIFATCRYVLPAWPPYIFAHHSVWVYGAYDNM